MIKPKAQRVGVFVDVQNLYYSAKHLHDAKVNFKALLDEAVKGRTLIRAVAYVIKTAEMKESSFFEALHKIGFEITAKDIQVFVGGAKEGTDTRAILGEGTSHYSIRYL